MTVPWMKDQKVVLALVNSALKNCSLRPDELEYFKRNIGGGGDKVELPALLKRFYLHFSNPYELNPPHVCYWLDEKHRLIGKQGEASPLGPQWGDIEGFSIYDPSFPLRESVEHTEHVRRVFLSTGKTQRVQIGEQFFALKRVSNYRWVTLSYEARIIAPAEVLAAISSVRQRSGKIEGRD